MTDADTTRAGDADRSDTDPCDRRRLVLAEVAAAEREARVELSLELRVLLGLPFVALGRTSRNRTGRRAGAAVFDVAAELPSVAEWLAQRGSRSRAEHLRSWLGLADVPASGYTR